MSGGAHLTVVDLFVGFWILSGVCGAIAETWRRWRRHRRRTSELRHQRRVELARARAGQPPLSRPPIMHLPGPPGPATAAHLAPPPPSATIPAAVQPAPPSAQVIGVPGQCRHEKIVPAITDDGELVKWLCAAPQCRAEFPPGTAIYAPPEPTS